MPVPQAPQARPVSLLEAYEEKASSRQPREADSNGGTQAANTTGARPAKAATKRTASADQPISYPAEMLMLDIASLLSRTPAPDDSMRPVLLQELDTLMARQQRLLMIALRDGLRPDLPAPFAKWLQKLAQASAPLSGAEHVLARKLHRGVGQNRRTPAEAQLYAKLKQLTRARTKEGIVLILVLAGLYEPNQA